MAYTFSNPVYGGQDPFVCKGDDGYYFISEKAGSGSIEVFHSDRLTRRGVSHIVYRAEESGESSADLWAPELWHFNGKWYIYYAGASRAGQEYWCTHRTFVLEADHPLGPYSAPVKLDLRTGGREQMAIDGSVLQLAENDFVIFYMGRDEERELNCLYMARMDSPTHVCGEPVLLSAPELPWESDINEGPFPIYRNGRVSLLYAANAAHLPEYCLGLQICDDPSRIMDPGAWHKLPEPLLTRSGNVVGPGHGCIVSSPDGTEDWLLYHSKFDHDYTLPGGWNRVANLLKVTWKDDVIPVFGEPHQLGAPVTPPSGEADLPEGNDIDLRLGEECIDCFEAYTYSREDTVWTSDHCIRIDGSIWPDFGDKLILREAVYGDCVIRLEFRSISRSGIGGLLFGVDLPAAGAVHWRGFGVFGDRAGHVELVRSDGSKIETIKKKHLISEGEWKLEVRVSGCTAQITADGEILFTYRNTKPITGQTGLGTLGGDAEFRKLKISGVQR